ncbi:MAG: mechanosensitive ion channel family protein [Phycisphaerae bacterium]|nr:mechanosensitive ion channel family protein [Phycisphaerae bacterium]
MNMLSLAEMPEIKAALNEGWQLTLVPIILVAGVIIGKIAQSMLGSSAKRLKNQGKSDFLQIFLYDLSKPAFLAIFGLAIFLSRSGLKFSNEEIPGLNLDPSTYALWSKVAQAVMALAITWFVYRSVDLVELIMKKRPKDDDQNGMEQMLIPAIRKTLRVVIVIIAGLFIADNVFNQDIATILAAAGIGGLAVALAAKETIENFFGSINIFADRPFKVGERIKSSGFDGTVEEVGFRSTRIRTSDGHLVTIPNSKIANNAVENVSMRTNIKRVINLGLTYDTSPAKMELALQLIKDILAKFEPINNNPDLLPRVVFNDFKDYTLNIMIIFWFSPSDYWDLQAVNQKVNLDIMRAFEENGIEFAFPTQTLYLKKDNI